MSWQELPLDRIYFDSTNGVPGTTWPIGTPTVPSDVIADVITMCADRNIHTIQVHGALTLAAAMQHYNFVGYEHEDVADVISLGGQDVDGSHISGMLVAGAQGGANFLTIIRCIVNAVTNFQGQMNRCSFWGGATSTFKDGGYIDLIDCESIYGAVTITVQAPTRASIKNWRGNLTLSAQDGGVCKVRGFKGTLVIDTMTAGTLDIYANGADITINVSCDTAGTINIYGNARVTDNHGVGITVNDYTLEGRTKGLDDIHDDVGGLVTSKGRQLFTMDFWSESQEEVQLSDTVGNKTFPTVTVADLPNGATVVRAIAMFKFRMIENVHATLANNLDGATVANTSQVIRVQESGNGTYVDAIDFVDNQFNVAAATREGGDVIIGTHDIASTVDANDTYTFLWLQAMADEDHLQFNDVQVGLRIWYSV